MVSVFDNVVFVTHPSWAALTRKYNNITKENLDTPARAKLFIESEIMPHIRFAANQPSTLVVFINTPPFLTQGKIDEIFNEIKGLDDSFLEVRTHERGFDLKPFLRRLRFLDLELTAKLYDAARYRQLEAEKTSLIRQIVGISSSKQRKVLAIERAVMGEIKSLLGKRVLIATGKHGLTPPAIAKELKEMLKDRGFELAEKAVIKAYGAWREYCARNYPGEFAFPKNLLVVSEKGTRGFGKREGNFKQRQVRGQKRALI